MYFLSVTSRNKKTVSNLHESAKVGVDPVVRLVVSKLEEVDRGAIRILQPTFNSDVIQPGVNVLVCGTMEPMDRQQAFFLKIPLAVIASKAKRLWYEMSSEPLAWQNAFAWNQLATVPFGWYM